MILVTIWGDVVVKSLQFSQKDEAMGKTKQNETEPSAKLQEAFHPPGELGGVQGQVEAGAKA